MASESQSHRGVARGKPSSLRSESNALSERSESKGDLASQRGLAHGKPRAARGRRLPISRVDAILKAMARETAARSRPQHRVLNDVSLPKRGRPPKYGRRSRAVTVTLPEDVIARLGTVDADLGRAIVTIAENRALPRRPVAPPAAVVSYGRHAVIVVNPIKALKRLAGVQLVPIGDGRALIALSLPHSIPELELDIRDALRRGDVAGPDEQTLESVADILRDARLSRAVDVQQRTIIVLTSKRQRRTR
jgi:hypothetical protein